MFPSLSPAVQQELEHLAQSYGQPLVRSVELTSNYRFDPLNKTDRYGEVCMVVRRPNGHLLTMTVRTRGHFITGNPPKDELRRVWENE